jgi:hypothetical protein
VFVAVQPLQPCLTFMSKVKAYPSGAQVLHLRVDSWPYQPLWKVLIATNALAYFGRFVIDGEKKFYQIPTCSLSTANGARPEIVVRTLNVVAKISFLNFWAERLISC